MDYYIAGEATTFISPRSRGKVNVTVIGGETMPVQCLILHDHNDSAMVVLDDWGPLRGSLHSPASPYEDCRIKPQPLCNGISTRYMAAVGKYKAGVSISVMGKNREVSVWIEVSDVKRLIHLLQGPAHYHPASL